MADENAPPPSSERVILGDDEADLKIEQEAGQKRVDAFRASYSWSNQPLKWTSSRASLYAWLRVPLPRLREQTLAAIRAARDAEGTEKHAELDRMADGLYQADTAGDQSHTRNATIILYLAAHQSKDWQNFVHDKPRFLAAIEEWVDDNVKPGDVYSLAEITNKLIEEADATKAVVRPSVRNEEHAGN